MDFLTPELFSQLIIANLALGIVLAGMRFYGDMTRPEPDPAQHRQQKHDETSTSLDDTHQPTNPDS